MKNDEQQQQIGIEATTKTKLKSYGQQQQQQQQQQHNDNIIMMDTNTKNKQNNNTKTSNKILNPNPQLQTTNQPTSYNEYYTDNKLSYITNSYPITIYIILFLHVIYFYQYKKRKSYNNVCCSYNIISKEYKFYRIFTSMISYYPTGSSSSTSDNSISYHGDEQRSLLPVIDETTASATTPRNNSIMIMRQTIQEMIYEPFKEPNGILSGFPLLTYTSHILWSIRALETQFTSSLYLRFILLMIIFHTFFYCVYYKYSNARSLTRVRRVVTLAPWTTMTSIIITLISYFKYQYPFINIQIIPFFLYTWYNKANDSFVSVMIYIIEYIACIIIFYYLSKSRHLLGCFFGLLLSFITFPAWDILLTILKMNVYWCNCIFIWVFIICILSIKHSENSHDDSNDDNTIRRSNRRLGNPWMPCIDYVSWSSSTNTNDNQDNNDDEGHNDRNQSQEEEGEEDEFLSFNHNTTASTSTSSNTTTQDLEYQPRETNTTTTAAIRSRGSRQHHSSNRNNRDNNNNNTLDNGATSTMNGTNTLGYSLPDNSHDSD